MTRQLGEVRLTSNQWLSAWAKFLTQAPAFVPRIKPLLGYLRFIGVRLSLLAQYFFTFLFASSVEEFVPKNA
jgi:hypothetical protein